MQSIMQRKKIARRAQKTSTIDKGSRLSQRETESRQGLSNDSKKKRRPSTALYCPVILEAKALTAMREKDNAAISDEWQKGNCFGWDSNPRSSHYKCDALPLGHQSRLGSGDNSHYLIIYALAWHFSYVHRSASTSCWLTQCQNAVF